MAVTKITLRKFKHGPATSAGTMCGEDDAIFSRFEGWLENQRVLRGAAYGPVAHAAGEHGIWFTETQFGTSSNISSNLSAGHVTKQSRAR
jgi:hypothetical protein